MTIWKPRSLIARIMLVEMAAIVVVALLLPALMASVLRQTTRRFQDEILLTQARSVAAGIVPNGRGSWRVVLPPSLLATYATRYDGRAFVVVTGNGRIIAASAYAGSSPWRTAPRRAVPSGFAVAPFIGVSLPVRTLDTPVWAIVTQDESGPGAIVDDIVGSFLPRYSAFMLVMLLTLPVINALLIRRVVISVRRVSARAAEIGAQTLGIRLDPTDLPSEVVPLVKASNDLLGRLQDSFRQQNQFIGNVAHELRTPLATLRLRLDMVGDAVTRQLLERQCERLTHVISQLHDLASLELLAHETMVKFDAADLITEILEDRVPAMLASGHSVELLAPDRPVLLNGNRFLVGIALANLVDNAVRHTPTGTAITIRIDPDGTILVQDDGLGFAVQDDDAPARFWRADHLRSDSAGLGLSIVRRIVEVHGGTMSIANREPRGALVSISLRAR